MNQDCFLKILKKLYKFGTKYKKVVLKEKFNVNSESELNEDQIFRFTKLAVIRMFETDYPTRSELIENLRNDILE